MDIREVISERGRITVHVKPNASQTKITGYDEQRGVVRVDVAAPPEKGKANKELCAFLKKHLKKDVSVITGSASKRKVLQVVEDS